MPLFQNASLLLLLVLCLQMNMTSAVRGCNILQFICCCYSCLNKVEEKLHVNHPQESVVVVKVGKSLIIN